MISISEQAQTKIVEMIKEYKEETMETAYLKFEIQGGGCSGLSYSLGFEAEKKETQKIIPFDSFSVLIQKKDIPIIKGTIIDYKENLMTGGFTITNPNAIATCGCGSSFKTKEHNGTPKDC